MGEDGDELRNGEDQRSRVPLLYLFAVDAAAQLEVVGIGEFIGVTSRSPSPNCGAGLRSWDMRMKLVLLVQFYR